MKISNFLPKKTTVVFSYSNFLYPSSFIEEEISRCEKIAQLNKAELLFFSKTNPSPILESRHQIDVTKLSYNELVESLCKKYDKVIPVEINPTLNKFYNFKIESLSVDNNTSDIKTFLFNEARDLEVRSIINYVRKNKGLDLAVEVIPESYKYKSNKQFEKNQIVVDSQNSLYEILEVHSNYVVTSNSVGEVSKQWIRDLNETTQTIEPISLDNRLYYKGYLTKQLHKYQISESINLEHEDCFGVLKTIKQLDEKYPYVSEEDMKTLSQFLKEGIEITYALQLEEDNYYSKIFKAGKHIANTGIRNNEADSNSDAESAVLFFKENASDVELEEGTLIMKTDDIHKHLKSKGWMLARHKGGHSVYSHPKSRENIAVPNHRGDLAKGTVAQILRKSLVNEEIEEFFTEISKPTLVNYATKSFAAGNELHKKLKAETDPEEKEKIRDKITKRNTGVILASKKIKEEAQINDILTKEDRKRMEKVNEDYDGDEEFTEQDIQNIVDSVSEDDDSYLEIWEDDLTVIDTETNLEVPEDIVESEQLNEVLSRIERIKARTRFARTQSKRENRIKIALNKHSSTKVINSRARKMAIKALKEKIARKPLNKLSVPEKERLERIIEKRKKVIDRIAMKMVPKVRKIEQERLTHQGFTK